MNPRRIALVTGANKGIGKETVAKLSSKGLTVYLGSRDKNRGEAALIDLQKPDRDIRLVELDVTDDTSRNRAFNQIHSESGKLDILINNAGIAIDRSAPSEAPLESQRKTFETNFFGAVATTQQMLPLLRNSDFRNIVNVSSELGSLTLHNVPDWPFAGVNILAYNASKTALNAFTVLLAKELKPEGFRVNSVNPGYTATDLNHFRGTGTVQDAAAVIVKYALIGADGPTGGFFTSRGMLPW
jgi:NAD(P)-dependent dehydrogenase (short-subunit alcohol dehydrogenase family)